MRKGVYTAKIEGFSTYVYNHNGNLITNIIGTPEVIINGKSFELEEGFQTETDFYRFCIETDLY